jgi:hypothetical protein
MSVDPEVRVYADPFEGLTVQQDKWTVAAAASLSVATAMLDPGAAVAAVTSAAGVAFATKELNARREIRRTVRQRPFWYLHQVGRVLERSSSAKDDEQLVLITGWLTKAEHERSGSSNS